MCHPGYTPRRTFVYTHKLTHIQYMHTNTHTVSLRETLSSSKAQQTVKDKTEWKGGENKKMEKQSISLWQKRWTDRWWAGPRHTKTARKVKLRPHPLGQTRIDWFPVKASLFVQLTWMIHVHLLKYLLKVHTTLYVWRLQQKKNHY